MVCLALNQSMFRRPGRRARLRHFLGQMLRARAVKICDIESLDLCQFIFWVKSYPDGITASCFSFQAPSVSAYLLAQYHVSDNVCHC